MATKSLTEGNHTIQVSLAGYDTLNATINVTADGVLCVSVVNGACGGSDLPRVEVSGANVTPRTVTVYLKEATTASDVCSWIIGLGGWKSIEWTAHVLEAYYVYIGATGHSVGFSPVTWDDVLGLYYYYINQTANNPALGNSKTGCSFS